MEKGCGTSKFNLFRYIGKVRWGFLFSFIGDDLQTRACWRTGLSTNRQISADYDSLIVAVVQERRKGLIFIPELEVLMICHV